MGIWFGVLNHPLTKCWCGSVGSCLVFVWVHTLQLVSVQACFWMCHLPLGRRTRGHKSRMSYQAWMNKVGHEKGSSFLASISCKMNRYARSAIRSIFSRPLLIKTFTFEVTRCTSTVISRVRGLGRQKNFSNDLAKLPPTGNNLLLRWRKLN